MVEKNKKNGKKAENPYIIDTGRKLFFLAGAGKIFGRAEKGWEQGRSGGRRGKTKGQATNTGKEKKHRKKEKN
jgi:hypothetical protein